MKKIQTREEIEKKRNVTFMSVFMLFVLVVGTAGYGFLYSDSDSGSSSGEDSFDEFTDIGGRWAIDVDGQTLHFANHPDFVTDVQIEGSFFLRDYAGFPLYIDSDVDSIGSEVASTLGRFASRVQEACHGECEKDLPEKDCSENLIVIRENSENRVYQEEKCVFIEGDLVTADAFLFRVFGL